MFHSPCIYIFMFLLFNHVIFVIHMDFVLSFHPRFSSGASLTQFALIQVTHVGFGSV